MQWWSLVDSKRTQRCFLLSSCFKLVSSSSLSLKWLRLNPPEGTSVFVGLNLLSILWVILEFVRQGFLSNQRSGGSGSSASSFENSSKSCLFHDKNKKQGTLESERLVSSQTSLPSLSYIIFCRCSSHGSLFVIEMYLLYLNILPALFLYEN